MATLETLWASKSISLTTFLQVSVQQSPPAIVVMVFQEVRFPQLPANPSTSDARERLMLSFRKLLQWRSERKTTCSVRTLSLGRFTVLRSLRRTRVVESMYLCSRVIINGCCLGGLANQTTQVICQQLFSEYI